MLNGPMDGTETIRKTLRLEKATAKHTRKAIYLHHVDDFNSYVRKLIREDIAKWKKKGEI